MAKFKQALYKGKHWPYDVSDNGEVYTRPNRYNGYKNKMMKPIVSHNGYYRTTICNSGASKQLFVHRLVAETFIINDLKLPFINHKDGNKLNNNVDNLEWCTAAQNIHHAVDNKLMKSNINSEKVLEIKELVKTMKGKDIAAKYGVSKGLISQIKNGKIWI